MAYLTDDGVMEEMDAPSADSAPAMCPEESRGRDRLLLCAPTDAENLLLLSSVNHYGRHYARSINERAGARELHRLGKSP